MNIVFRSDYLRVGKHFFLFGLLIVLASCAGAQKKTANDISIEDEAPYGWRRSESAVITMTDANGAVAKKVSATVKRGKELFIDVKTLADGRYTLKVTVDNSTCYDNQFTTEFEKERKNERVVLKLTPSDRPRPIPAEKPVIYLYPEKTEGVAVKVRFKGELVKTIPAYNEGWQVTATPDGKITDKADGKQYPYLFWEGNTYKQHWNMSAGFVVSSADSKAFLEHVLPEMGLTAKEYNEFIDYWLPALQKNDYNLIHFSGAEYEDLAKLEITPQPDAVLRVFMVFRATDKNTPAEPQHFKPFERKGFTVVEWGGIQMPGAGVAGR